MSLANFKNTTLSFAANNEAAVNKLEQNHYVTDSLKRIREVCRQHQAESLLFLVPVKPAAATSHTDIAHNLDIFAGFNPLFPSNLTNDDYDPGGEEAHFNNQGHAKYAHFILEQLHRRGF